MNTYTPLFNDVEDVLGPARPRLLRGLAEGHQCDRGRREISRTVTVCRGDALRPEGSRAVMQIATLHAITMVVLLFASMHAASGTMNERARRPAASHLTADNTVGDLLSHPAFAGFSPLLLPWDDRRYDNNPRLRDVGSLLPYHSHVNPATVVDALNHMIDDVDRGRTIFYDIYDEADKKKDPTKRHTGRIVRRKSVGHRTAGIEDLFA